MDIVLCLQKLLLSGLVAGSLGRKVSLQTKGNDPFYAVVEPAGHIDERLLYILKSQ